MRLSVYNAIQKKMNSDRRRPRKRLRKFCPHCDEHLSKSAYYEHRSKYYNFRTKTWIKVNNEVIMESPSDSTDDDTKLLIQQLSHPLENIDGELHDGRQDVSLVFFLFHCHY